MKLASFVCLFLFTTAILVAQSNPAATAGQPIIIAPSSAAITPNSKTQARILDSYGKLPLSFEANQGQTDARVKFLSRGSGYTLFLTGDEAVFSLRGKKPKEESAAMWDQLLARPVAPMTSAVLRMQLVKANRSAKVTGVDEFAGKSNYFIGNDPKKWRGNVPEYAKVKYESIYSGIDLVYYGNQQQLEYDFVVKPGADPHRIQFNVQGATRIRCDQQGDLILRMSGGEVRWHKPAVYQEKKGVREEISARYAITHTNRVGFEVSVYDANRPLYIDPLIYSTYLGGSAADTGYAIVADSSGAAYVTGYTASTNFPMANALQSSINGASDVFVAKLNPSGSALVYSTYLGGSGGEYANGIAVDSSGNAYITGSTNSTDFPVTPGSFQTTCSLNSNACSDAFVSEINVSGAALVYSTYLGGSGDDHGYGIAVDSSGSAYVAGRTSSADFPTVNPVQSSNGGSDDAFVAKLSPSGTTLIYSTYLGGSSDDIAFGIAADSSGNAYITGVTGSSNFPTINALQPSIGGNNDAFVAKFSPTGSSLLYSTYLGGFGDDYGYGIAADSSGNAYVTGWTQANNFPTMNPLQSVNAGGIDAFVTRLNALGSAFVYSTYLGGSGTDAAFSIAVDSSGNAYIGGGTASNNFPTVNPLQSSNGGGYDAIVSKLDPSGSVLVYSTYLGGSADDYAYGIAVDGSGNAYVTGFTVSTNFPTMNPLQSTFGGGNNDSIVAKIEAQSAAPAVTLSPNSLNFGSQTVGFTSSPQVLTLTNIGSANLAITSISFSGLNSGDFSETDNCGTSVSLGKNCNITITLTPSSTGTRTAALSVTDNAPNSPQVVPLSGVGVLPAVTLSPTKLIFSTQVVFTTSAAQTVTLTNTGLGILSISKISLTGPFLQTNTCGTSVAAGASCTFTVTFRPTTIGTLTGAVSISDNAPGSPQKIALTGFGTYVKLAPTSLNFGNQPVGTKSLPKRITLSNKGSVAVSITRVAMMGTNAADFTETNTCGTSVAAGGSCFITVTFTPSAKGSRTAAVWVTDNGGASPQKVAVAGTGT